MLQKHHKKLYFCLKNSTKGCTLSFMDVKTLRKEVVKAIESQGRKKSWVAEQVGISARKFGEWLRGKSDLSKSELFLLCQVLNLNADKAA